MEREELIEHGAYPHRQRGTLLSIILVLGFFLLVLILLNSLTITLLSELGLGIAIIYSIIAPLRIRSFRRMRQELIERKVHSSPPPKTRMRLMILVTGLLFIIGPFLVVAIVDPFTWLVGIGSVICGVNLAEISLTIYVSRWVKANQTKLTRFEVWDMDEYGRGRLRESGVKAARDPK